MGVVQRCRNDKRCLYLKEVRLYIDGSCAYIINAGEKEINVKRGEEVGFWKLRREIMIGCGEAGRFDEMVLAMDCKGWLGFEFRGI